MSARQAREAMALIDCGRKRLHFAETKMNRHSSRSHAVCLVSVERIVKSERSGVGALTSRSRVPPPIAEEEEEEGSASPSKTASTMIADDETAADEAESQVELERALAGEKGEVSVKGRLTIVDLAGSERIKKTGAEGGDVPQTQTHAPGIARRESANLTKLCSGRSIRDTCKQPSHQPPSIGLLVV
jgi:hypothetical protein